MSMYLFDEQPIIANKTLAREIGLNEALILQQINYWIEINKKSGNNYYDGRYWTYNSIRAWQEKDFDYMSFDTKNQKGEQKMKNIDEKILMAEEEIKQLQNKRKKLISQQKQEERKKRDKRLYEKGAVFESIFTESKDFTKDEFYQLITFPNIK